MKFAQRIKELRVLNKMTQEDLAQSIGVSRTTVTGYETRGTEPSLDKLLEISKVFNVPCDFLIGNDDFIKENRRKIPIVEACVNDNIFSGLQQTMAYVTIEDHDDLDGVFAYKIDEPKEQILICLPDDLKNNTVGIFYIKGKILMRKYITKSKIHIFIHATEAPIVLDKANDFIYLGRVIEVRERP